MSQALYWILTIPHADFTPFLPPGVQWIRGQLECGQSESNYLHWQLCIALPRKLRLRGIKSIFGESAHCEPTRSDAAMDYVWKDETAIENTRFELGQLKLRRNSHTDWDAVRNAAKSGELDSVPSDVFVRCYNQLSRIAADNLKPAAIHRNVRVYWGKSGAGKSRLAWEQAGLSAYPKDPRSKFWCGYRDHAHVVIDEFRGGIDISHMLRWCDHYPVIIEVKGGARILTATDIWITSNIHPRDWYPELDSETKQALLRRMSITEFHGIYGQ